MSFWFNLGLEQAMTGQIDLDTDDIRLMLLKDSGNWVPTRTEQLLDQAPGVSIVDDEANATNYVRKAVTRTIAGNDPTNQARITFPLTVTWSSLGGPFNNLITAVIGYCHKGADTQNIPLWYWDTINTPTTGDDLTATMSVNSATIDVGSPATFWYHNTVARVLKNQIDIDSSDMRVLLLQNTGNYTPDPDTVEIDDGSGNAIADDEATATGYVRKTTNLSVSRDNLANKIRVIQSSPITWSTLGGLVNNDITAAILYYHFTSDPLSCPLLYWDLPTFRTRGTGITLEFDPDGNGKIATA